MPWTDLKVFGVAAVLLVPVWIPLGIEENFSANSFPVIIQLFRDSIRTSRLIRGFAGSELWLYSAWNAAHYAGGVIGKLAPIFMGATENGRIHSIIMGQILIGFPGRLLHVIGPDWLPEWWIWMLISRFATGYILGLCNTFILVHLAEISNPNQRGSNAMLFIAIVSFGAIIGVVLGFENVLGNYRYWQYPYLISLIFSFVSIISAIFIPESPSFWAAAGNTTRARDSLIFYQGNDTRLNDVILDGGKCEDDQEPQHWTAVIRQLFRDRSLQRPNRLSIALAICNAPTFFFVVYSTVVFTDVARIPLGTAQLLTFILRITITFILVTALALQSSNQKHRKLVSQTCQFRVTSFISCTSLLLLSGIHYCIIAVHRQADPNTTRIVEPPSEKVEELWIPLWILQTAFVACLFAGEISISLGIRSMFQSYVPELYPYRYRVTGKAFGGAVYYGFGTLLTLVFYNLIEALSWASFLVIGVPCCLAFGYCYRNLPETRGRELHEIQGLLLSNKTEIHDQNCEVSPLLSVNDDQTIK